MRVMVIDGAPADGRLSALAEAIAGELASTPADTHVFQLRALSIQPCLGCMACMLRTPGLCAIQDDQQTLLREILRADRVLLLYPLVCGFMSALTKVFVDRLFPLELPYIEFQEGRMTHRLRYGRYPAWGFIVGSETGMTDEEFEIAADLNRHLASYYRSPIFLNKRSSISPQEAAHAIVCD